VDGGGGGPCSFLMAVVHVSRQKKGTKKNIPGTRLEPPIPSYTSPPLISRSRPVICYLIVLKYNSLVKDNIYMKRY
jgi:hypothetical protein